MAGGYLDVFRKTWGWFSSPAAIVTPVTQRFDLVGTDTKKFSLVGTRVDQFELAGTSTKKFNLTGV